jgi:hypothetical protein
MHIWLDFVHVIARRYKMEQMVWKEIARSGLDLTLNPGHHGVGSLTREKAITHQYVLILFSCC